MSALSPILRSVEGGGLVFWCPSWTPAKTGVFILSLR